MPPHALARPGSSHRDHRPPSAIDVVIAAYDAFTRRRAPRTAAVVAAALADVPAGAQVLDVGAGTGRVAAALERGRGFRVTASDVVPATGGKARVLRGGLVAADGEALPFAPASFDAAYLSYVLHHVAASARVVEELRRVVRASGRVVIVEFDAASGLARLFHLAALMSGRRCRFFDPATLAAMLGSHGLAPTVRRLDRVTLCATARVGPPGAR